VCVRVCACTLAGVRTYVGFSAARLCVRVRMCINYDMSINGPSFYPQ